MPLDHFVSQVHLKNFYAEALGKRMYATRKTDLQSYQCDAASQCRVMDGNTNLYLEDERAVEEFLKSIEGSYNASVDEFRAGKPTWEAIYTIAGFTAYVMSCSPAAMRINTLPIQGAVEMAAAMVDRRGTLPEPPAALGGGTLTDMMANGRVVANIDPKYPQAIGIAGIMDRVAILGNFRWEVLLNDHEDTPYFTSDFPVANEPTADPRMINRLVPLAPNIAVRLHPRFEAKGKGLKFPLFGLKMTQVSRSQAVNINREIVRAAETTVYHSRDAQWIPSFIAKNRHFRVETWNTQVDYGKKILQISSQGTRPYTFS